jgi:hypothetical protein
MPSRPVHCVVGCSFSFDDDERHPWYKIEHKHEDLIDANEQIKNPVERIPWHWKPFAVHSIDEVTAESKCSHQKR